MKSEKLKTGDKFMCIDNSWPTDGQLELKEIYTFNKIESCGELILFELPDYSFKKQRFISFSELRKLKIQKLNEISSI